MLGWTPETLELAALALAKFDHLSESELKMLCGSTIGGVAFCGRSRNNDDPGNDPAQAAQWDNERTIRADLIRWLCIDRTAKGFVDPRGIAIHAAKVADTLDLSFATVPFPVIFVNCLFASAINLIEAKLEALHLLASLTASIVAGALRVRGNLSFRDTIVEGEVRLLDAEIGKTLECNNTAFKSGLIADRIKVSGSVFLRAGFNAEGEVRLNGAEIGGVLDCAKGMFKNAGGIALNAEGIKVAGSAFFGKGFNAEGEVRLVHAEIGGSLSCEQGTFQRGTFEKSPGTALNASGIKVTGNVFLRGGFKSEGEVNLAGAQIGANLECIMATFKNAGGPTLNAEGIKVAGSAFLGKGFNAEGEVRMVRAEIGGNLSCEQGTFQKGTFEKAAGTALNANGIKVTGNVFLRAGFKSEGEVNLAGADIGANLECDTATFKNAGGIALNADAIRVSGSVSLRNGFSLDGEVRLTAADIAKVLACEGGRFTVDSLVNAQQASVTGSFFWRNVRWNLESESDPQPGAVKPGPSAWLNLSHTTVGPMFDDKNSWPSTGRLRLDGFVYARIGAGPDDAKSRLEWLSRQGDNFWPQPYRQLAGVLREAGDDAGSKRVLVEMENSRRRCGNLPWWSWTWAWILRPTIGYGYRPFRAGWWVAAFVILGFFLFSWGQDAGVLTEIKDKDAVIQNKDVAATHEQNASGVSVYQPFNGFIYSLETFLPLVDLQFAKHWLPNANLKPNNPVDLMNHMRHWPVRWLPHWNHNFGKNFGKHLRWYFWFHILAGWFFTTMVIAGVTGLVRKD